MRAAFEAAQAVPVSAPVQVRTRLRDGPSVRIYQPSRSVMQAGKANTKRWVLEFEPQTPSFVEPLMGWIGGADTMQQVRLTFPSRESAEAFASRQGLQVAV